MAYCLVFKHSDYARAGEMLKLIKREGKEALPEFYKELLSKTEKEIEAKGGAKPQEPAAAV
jgi:hypothetical protein